MNVLVLLLFALLILSPFAFADVAPDYGGSCYCCGPSAIVLMLGALFLLDGKRWHG